MVQPTSEHVADVSLFVSSTLTGQDRLYNIDATVGQARAVAKTDFNATGPITATAATDFNTGGVANLLVTANQTGSQGNNIVLDIQVQDLGGSGETISVTGTTIEGSPLRD